VSGSSQAFMPNTARLLGGQMAQVVRPHVDPLFRVSGTRRSPVYREMLACAD
jgi:hypothetical protein